MTAGTAAALLALLAAAAPRAGAEAPARLGVDASHHSGAVDWSAVAGAGYTFAYVKASEGIDAADPAFDGHWQELARTPVARGAYHFFVTEDDPESQARFFLSRARPRPGDLVPVVDVETLGRGTRGDLAAALRRFLAAVEESIGARPMIYTSARFWDAHYGEGFGDYPLWVAEYGVETPALPRGWSRWTAWQFEGDASLPGGGTADRSRLHPGASLESLRIPGPAR